MPAVAAPAWPCGGATVGAPETEAGTGPVLAAVESTNGTNGAAGTISAVEAGEGAAAWLPADPSGAAGIARTIVAGLASTTVAATIVGAIAEPDFATFGCPSSDGARARLLVVAPSSTVADWLGGCGKVPEASSPGRQKLARSTASVDAPHSCITAHSTTERGILVLEAKRREARTTKRVQENAWGGELKDPSVGTSAPACVSPGRGGDTFEGLD